MTRVRWLNPAEDRAWRGYRRMTGLLDLAIYRDLADDAGLSEPDYDVLSSLSETEGHRLRLTELADRMLWSASRVSHHIRRMESRGLVRREGCASDGRGTVICLTKAGLRAIQSAAPGHVESVRRHLIDRLDEREIKVLGDIAEKVIAGLTAPHDQDR
ncbi:MAG TPA: MarR family transcriptional regulator [Actinopolymorphaceae bacterium]|jgi:DNA-binding MarR family transcriptional regulator